MSDGLSDFETSIKVIIVGNGQVGKTSMMNRYTRGVMTDKYKKTIGTDFCEKTIELKNGESVKLMLWDTAGQEMFSQLTKQYYRGARAVVYVFSSVDRDSFEAIESWKKKVEEECPNICGVLVQNKVDLIDQAKMTAEEVEELAKRVQMRLYRTCVKTDTLVSKVFEDLTEMVMSKGFDEDEEDGDKKAKEKEKPKSSAPTSSSTKTDSTSDKQENGGKTAKPSKKGESGGGVIKLEDGGQTQGKDKGKCCK